MPVLLRSTYSNPSGYHVSMSKSSTPKTVTFTRYATGVGPAGSSLFPHTLASNTAGNITVTALGPAFEFDHEYLLGWEAFNYAVGLDPELISAPIPIQISVTDPDVDVTDGIVTLSGLVGGQIVIHAFTEDSLVYDRFIDSDGTAQSDHTPDTAPAGGEEGWQGGVGSIVSNALALGCCSGNWNLAKIYAGIHDHFIVYADCFRSNAPYDQRIRLGITGRSTLAYTSHIDFWVEGLFYDYDLVSVVWLQLGGDSQGGTLEAEYNWPRGTAKRLMMHFSGANVKFYISDIGGANTVLFGSVTLTAPLNSSDNDYTGVHASAYDGGTAYTLFSTTQVMIEVAVNTLDFTGNQTGIPTPAQYVDIVQSPSNFPLGSLEASVVYADGDGWIDVELDSTSCPTFCSVICDPEGMSEGVYHATITIDSIENDGDPQEIAVEFTILDTVLSVNPDSVSISIIKIA